MQYLAEAQTDIGTIKTINQDSLMVKIADTDIGEVLMAVICDGLGGLQHGEIASGNVVLGFQEWFCSTLPVLVARRNIEQEIETQWRALVNEMNTRIICYGEENSIKLGTTLTAVLFVEEHYYVIHVGDCRLYHINDNIKQLTRDQTFIAKQIELEKMTLQEAQRDSRRNMLLQCIGVNNNLHPDFFRGTISEDSIYLLCTDGFRHKITEDEIYEYCNPNKNVKEQMMIQNLQYLISLNKDRQETDNISAILIRTRGR